MKNNLKISSKFLKKNNKNYLKNLFSRVLISIIVVLVSLIYINQSDKNLLLYKKYILTDSLPFNKIENYLKKITGNNDILKGTIKDNTQSVFNEKLEYKNISKFYDGCALEVPKNYLIPIIDSGIVVFVGEKDNYGKTIIVQGSNGVDIWYGNVTNENVKIYEYVEKGNLLGETSSEELYLVFMKDGKYLNYEEYI